MRTRQLILAGSLLSAIPCAASLGAEAADSAPLVKDTSPAVPTPRAVAAPRADQIPWAGEATWPLAVPRRSPLVAVVGKDDNLVFSRGADERASHIERVLFHRQVLWRHALPDRFQVEVALLIVGQTVYVAHYCAIASGATLLALDLKTGQQRFATTLRGLGPIDHSKYSNHIVLKEQDGFVVVFGNEAAGRYVEVVDPQTGKTLSNHVRPGARPDGKSP